MSRLAIDIGCSQESLSRGIEENKRTDWGQNELDSREGHREQDALKTESREKKRKNLVLVGSRAHMP